ncbi:MAG: hypothetical protein QXW60_03655 [Nitrososphaerota archaeon]
MRGGATAFLRRFRGLLYSLREAVYPEGLVEDLPRSDGEGCLGRDWKLALMHSGRVNAIKT